MLVYIAAGRSVTEEKLEAMLESDDPQIFTQDVCMYMNTMSVVPPICKEQCESSHYSFKKWVEFEYF